MPEVIVRKRVVIVEEILHEGGPPPAQPLLRGAALAVIRNPFASKAITLHVYGKELLRSSCFEPLGEDRYRRVERSLSYAEA